jgi:hypothetical protein
LKPVWDSTHARKAESYQGPAENPGWAPFPV